MMCVLISVIFMVFLIDANYQCPEKSACKAASLLSAEVILATPSFDNHPHSSRERFMSSGTQAPAYRQSNLPPIGDM